MRALYPLYKWLFFAPWLVLSTVLFGSATIVISVLLSPRQAIKWAVVPWARLGAFFTPASIHVRGQEHIKPGQSYVVVANHQSFFDIWIIFGWLGMDVRWVMKKELRRMPIIGAAADKLGCVFVDRGNTQSAVQSLKEAASRIVNGTSMMFFPEGTRSRDGQLGRFKKGAFRVALDMDLPLLPVTIVGANSILPADGVDLRPGQAEMIIHEPIYPDPDDHGSLDALMKRARAAIVSGLPAGEH